MSERHIAILGDGGHARAVANVLDFEMASLGPYFFVPEGMPVPPEGDVIIGVGDIEIRKKLWAEYAGRVVFDPQIMRGVIIGGNVSFAPNVLVNTGAQIDHDCIIDAHCVISPGAILCGGVHLCHSTFIGAGAIILENVKLEPETYIPAGTLVVGPDDLRRPQRLVSHRDLEAASSPPPMAVEG